MTMMVIAHTFSIGDVEDPEIYAAHPLYEWEKSDAGQWMMKHSDPLPNWHKVFNAAGWEYRFQIRGYLTPELYTFWKLKYG